MATSSRADYLTHWETLVVKVEENEELSFMEGTRAELEVEREGATEARLRQIQFRALAQKASRDLDAHIARGKVLQVRLHDGIRMFYGRDAEKLAEFGLQPFRPVQRPKPPAPPPPEDAKKKPSKQGPAPARTAAPATDGTIEE
jgi:hypothetical protein